jgi:hypothetical protein
MCSDLVAASQGCALFSATGILFMVRKRLLAAVVSYSLKERRDVRSEMMCFMW